MNYSSFIIDKKKLLDQFDFERLIIEHTKELSISPSQIIKINIFTELSSAQACAEFKATLTNGLNTIYGENIPALSIISQPSKSQSEAAIELTYADNNSEYNIQYKEFQKHHYTLVKTANQKLIYSGSINLSAEDQFLLSVQQTFDFAEQLLDHEEMDFSNVVRQWNYIEDLLGFEKQAGQNLQRYQIFNEVRSFYYDPSIFRHGFPSATGIGCTSGHLTIEFIALQDAGHSTTRAIKSPVQEDAYQYSEQVLEGDALNQIEKRPPFFERANSVQILDQKTLFVSGTAAITGEETIDSSDASYQTKHTIENISALISHKNLKKNGVDLIPEEKFKMVRTYIKHVKDFPNIEALVKELMPSHCYTFVLADICRDNLLVEIEGIILLED